MKKQLAVTVIAMTLLASAYAQDELKKVMAARTELHPIPSLTLSDEQFLKGDSAAGKPVVVTGLLRIAQGAGRLPVVVMIHGSGGMGPTSSSTQEFNAMGVSTFALDGFTGRGLTNVNPDQASLRRLNMILDVYRMLDMLAKHPRVDPSRVALMGFSRGGQGALFASMKAFIGRGTSPGLTSRPTSLSIRTAPRRIGTILRSLTGRSGFFTAFLTTTTPLRRANPTSSAYAALGAM